jgi:hypothetical protein
MSKKKAPKPGKKKKGKKKKRVLLSSYNILTTITIETGNVIVNPVLLVGLPKAPIVWIIDNQDSASHDVSVDPLKFKNKKTGKKENPLTKSDVLSATVPAGGRDVFFGLIKGGLGGRRYKYAIASTNGDGTSNELDPDLDVIDPGSRPG